MILIVLFVIGAVLIFGYAYYARAEEKAIVAVLALLILAVSCAPPETPQEAFHREFNAGADCPRLYELRNKAKVGASDAVQEEMNVKLRSVGCYDSTAKRH